MSKKSSLKHQKLKYYLVTITDVEGLLNFSKNHTSELKDEVSEQNRSQEELEQFISLLHSRFHEEIMYIGEEKILGKHVERFLFNHGGFMEIMLEKPLVLNAHFLHIEKAQRFSEALKKTLHYLIPPHPVKEIFIDSITVEEHSKNPLTMETWMRMHNIYLKKSIMFTVLTVTLVAIFEITKAGIESTALEWFNINSQLAVIVGAAVVAFAFEPIKKKIEEFVNKWFIK
jgi:hypothetical protein